MVLDAAILVVAAVLFGTGAAQVTVPCSGDWTVDNAVDGVRFEPKAGGGYDLHTDGVLLGAGQRAATLTNTAIISGDFSATYSFTDFSAGTVNGGYAQAIVYFPSSVLGHALLGGAHTLAPEPQGGGHWVSAAFRNGSHDEMLAVQRFYTSFMVQFVRVGTVLNVTATSAGSFSYITLYGFGVDNAVQTAVVLGNGNPTAALDADLSVHLESFVATGGGGALRSDSFDCVSTTSGSSTTTTTGAVITTTPPPGTTTTPPPSTTSTPPPTMTTTPPPSSTTTPPPGSTSTPDPAGSDTTQPPSEAPQPTEPGTDEPDKSGAPRGSTVHAALAALLLAIFILTH